MMKDGSGDVSGSLLKPGAVIKAVNGNVGVDDDIYPLLNHTHRQLERTVDLLLKSLK